MSVAEAVGVVRPQDAANGPDIWAVAGCAHDDSSAGLSIGVADVGADDWSATRTTGGSSWSA